MATITVLFLVGIAASFISGMVGGGSGLILAPSQVILGIDPKLATTTTHFGFIGVSLGALARFSKERELRSGHVLPLTFVSLASGLVGPYLLFSIDSKIFQPIVGALVLICIPLFILKNTIGTDSVQSSGVRIIFGYLSFFLLLTLQVAFGAATGIIAIFALVYFFGLSMLETSAALRLPNLASSLIGLLVYAQYGKIDYESGLTLGVATALGGYFGSALAIKGGNRVVKHLFVAVAAVLGVTLLFPWMPVHIK